MCRGSLQEKLLPAREVGHLHWTQEQPFLKFVVVFRGCQLQTLKSVSLTTHFSEGLIIGAQLLCSLFFGSSATFKQDLKDYMGFGTKKILYSNILSHLLGKTPEECLY